MSLRLCLLILIISLNACFPAIDKEELVASLESISQNEKLAGFSVCVFDKDKIHFNESYGYSDFAAKIKYENSTQQILASVSKVFIGIAIVKCQELGLLHFEDDINIHLDNPISNPQYPQGKIKIKHIATHTAGFKYSEKFTDEYNYLVPDSSLNYLIKNFFTEDGMWFSPNNFHKTKPGMLWDYSNAGATLGALIVQNASGMEYEAFLKKYLFEPLNLNISRHRKGAARSEHYILDTLTKFRVIERNEMACYPAGDFMASSKELSKVFQMILNGGTLENKKILTRESVDLLLGKHQAKNVKLLDSSHLNMGVFWFHESNIFGMPTKLVGHSGGDTGIATFAWYSPETELGYIFLSNTGQEEVSFGPLVLVWQSLFKYGKSIKK